MRQAVWIKVLIFLMVISQSFFPRLAFAETASETLQLQLVEKITDQTTTIKGTTSPNVTVKVENSAGVLLNSTTADETGGFAVEITKQLAKTLLKLTAEDVDGNTYAIEVTVAGWVKQNGLWYYVDQDGKWQTGWLEDQGSHYFLTSTGAMKTGWLLEQGKWYFFKNNGAMATGWIYDKYKWYYLNGNGTMVTGWVLDAGKWYFLDGSGAMKTGWVKTNNRWYYLNSSGAMATGWVLWNGQWYFLEQSGAMATGWLLDRGQWYYLNSDGSMKTGWVKSGLDWYFLGKSGAVSGAELDAPLVAQMPELPRGCEVTSLAMLLLDAGVSTNKMTLASQVRKDPTPYSKSNGQIYFGNPYSGFVGDMYTFSKPGLGVYHGPIAELAAKYLPNRVVDLTGGNFEEIYKYLNNGKPVWVINNVMFDTVPSQYWQTWNTPSGKISITYKEHSVLVTGYDSQYIYFNDPLSVTKNRKVAISAFKRGWQQMGRQAISLR